jgi:anti-sigma B factor antagonist
LELGIDVREAEGVTILDVEGEVDLYTAPQLEEGLRKAATASPPLLAVNLTKVTYIDSTALRVLTDSQKRARERRGAVVVITTQPTIEKIFRITGLGTILPVVASEREAVERLRTHPPTARGG